MSNKESNGTLICRNSEPFKKSMKLEMYYFILKKRSFIFFWTLGSQFQNEIFYKKEAGGKISLKKEIYLSYFLALSISYTPLKKGL